MSSRFAARFALFALVVLPLVTLTSMMHPVSASSTPLVYGISENGMDVYEVDNGRHRGALQGIHSLPSVVVYGQDRIFVQLGRTIFAYRIGELSFASKYALRHRDDLVGSMGRNAVTVDYFARRASILDGKGAMVASQKLQFRPEVSATVGTLFGAVSERKATIWQLKNLMFREQRTVELPTLDFSRYQFIDAYQQSPEKVDLEVALRAVESQNGPSVQQNDYTVSNYYNDMDCNRIPFVAFQGQPIALDGDSESQITGYARQSTNNIVLATQKCLPGFERSKLGKLIVVSGSHIVRRIMVGPALRKLHVYL